MQPKDTSEPAAPQPGEFPGRGDSRCDAGEVHSRQRRRWCEMRREVGAGSGSLEFSSQQQEPLEEFVQR